MQGWFWTSAGHALFLLSVSGLHTHTILDRHSLLQCFNLSSQSFCRVFQRVVYTTSCCTVHHLPSLQVLQYMPHEGNREINIQAIVEEHYERYMDQEEEYEREHGESISDSDTVFSDNDYNFASVGRISKAYSSVCVCVKLT